MMKHYEKLLAKGSFSREQLIEIVGTATAANQVIYEYQKKWADRKSEKRFLCGNQHGDETACVIPLSDRFQSVPRCLYHPSQCI